MIRVKSLVKQYKIPIRNKGIKAALSSVVKKKIKIVNAVNNINFQINDGEIVAFLGKNGAGKTTTIKMLSGLLYPTSGEISVCGYKPYERNNNFLKNISLTMGNRGRLNWNLPVADSFDFYKTVYNCTSKKDDNYLDGLIDIMNISDFLDKPARNLSLGQRMKAEIVLSLIHHPQVIFLDEPTIGLDITAQMKIREFIKDYNEKYNATIMITSHNMNDIETLCNRVIIIDDGNIIFDGGIRDLSSLVSNNKIVKITFKENNFPLSNIGVIRCQNENEIELLVERQRINYISLELLTNPAILDINITDIPIEEIVSRIFNGDLIDEIY